MYWDDERRRIVFGTHVCLVCRVPKVVDALGARILHRAYLMGFGCIDFVSVFGGRKKGEGDMGRPCGVDGKKCVRPFEMRTCLSFVVDIIYDRIVCQTVKYDREEAVHILPKRMTC